MFLEISWYAQCLHTMDRPQVAKSVAPGEHNLFFSNLIVMSACPYTFMSTPFTFFTLNLFPAFPKYSSFLYVSYCVALNISPSPFPLFPHQISFSFVHLKFADSL